VNLPLISNHPIPQRESLPQHFTASAVVIFVGHVLLVHHRRIGAWLPPGGHIDEFELPHQTAVRETFEETGVEIEVLSEPMPDTGDFDAFFLPAPLSFHVVKAVEKANTVYHLDLAYLCRPILTSNQKEMTLPEIRLCKEVIDARWVHLSDLTNLHLAKNVIETLAIASAKLNLGVKMPTKMNASDWAKTKR
jgi:8-oxo-dGTP diphosphatase